MIDIKYAKNKTLNNVVCIISMTSQKQQVAFSLINDKD